MNVLSLFDGMSCGRIALERAGIQVGNYFASEIDKYAIKVSQNNWDDVTAVGDVAKISFSNGVLYTEAGEFQVERIDLVIAGSPCQGFSMAGKKLAFDDERSKLYFVFERILKEIQAENPNVKFLLENVKMKQEYKDVISKHLGVTPIAINSNLLSAQNRYRLYWANFEINPIGDKGILLKDILQEEVPKKYYIKNGRLQWLKNFGELKERDGYVAFNPTKSKYLTPAPPDASWNCICILQWPHGSNSGGFRAIDGKTPAVTTSSWENNNLLLNEGLVRKLTPEECEKLQTVPVGYTSCVSDSQRYKMLGNGWTVDIIASIFKNLK